MDDILISKIAILKEYPERHRFFWEKMCDAYGGTLYPLDLLANAVLNRSMALIAGFCSLIEARNLICAVPLIRLQIDNAIRFYAAFIVSDPHDFAGRVIKGIPIKKIKDKNHKLMTDKYLVQQLSKRYTWLEGFYEKTSGYIHFSEEHIFHAISSVSKKDRTCTLKIGAEDKYIPREVYIEAVAGFTAVTDIVLEYIQGWIFTKNNPQVARKDRGKKDSGL